MNASTATISKGRPQKGFTKKICSLDIGQSFTTRVKNRPLIGSFVYRAQHVIFQNKRKFTTSKVGANRFAIERTA